ncbi:MAG: hypothetical protein V9E91_13135 [Burkholderiaceae bacterium]
MYMLDGTGLTQAQVKQGEHHRSLHYLTGLYLQMRLNALQRKSIR